MIIPDKIKTLWYEDKDGNKYYPQENTADEPPTGFKFMYTLSPMTLHDQVLVIIDKDEVANCKHKKIRETFGWIDGVEGRECIECGGTQSKQKHYDTPSWWPPFLKFPKIPKPWQKKWSAHGSKTLVRGETGIDPELLKALMRVYDPRQAMLIAGIACERCLNVLLKEHTKFKGYKEHSDEWEECGTSCMFCKHLD